MENYLGKAPCGCGRIHTAAVEQVLIGKGVLAQLPQALAGCKKPFILADVNTFAAAGETVCRILDVNHIQHTEYVFSQQMPEPDEATVGAALLHFDCTCDAVIGVGGGVINDVGKLLSHTAGIRYLIVGTAPSMDGYASATSSMSRDGLKVSLPTRCPDVIIGDTEILKNAPTHLLAAGLGDMLAKYVSLAEWRIAHLITGEYYCERVAALVRSALKKCVDNAQGLLCRQEDAVAAVFEGLVIGGVAMAYAGVSRPASGVEHYFSHVWDMRGLEFGTPVERHGIQCGTATLAAVRLYEALEQMKPDAQKAAAYAAAFDYEQWKQELRQFLGRGAETMIALEAREGKYRTDRREARFAVIEKNWDAILRILQEELPSSKELETLMKSVDIPTELSALGVDSPCARITFKATKDIRDKYVLSRLAWDMGVLEELCLQL